MTDVVVLDTGDLQVESPSSRERAGALGGRVRIGHAIAMRERDGALAQAFVDRVPRGTNSYQEPQPWVQAR
jgi:hypothetical protein